MIKSYDDLRRHDVKIKDSIDSFFYIDTNVNLISLQNLENCTVLVGGWLELTDRRWAL